MKVGLEVGIGAVGKPTVSVQKVTIERQAVVHKEAIE